MALSYAWIAAVSGQWGDAAARQQWRSWRARSASGWPGCCSSSVVSPISSSVPEMMGGERPPRLRRGSLCLPAQAVRPSRPRAAAQTHAGGTTGTCPTPHPSGPPALQRAAQGRPHSRAIDSHRASGTAKEFAARAVVTVCAQVRPGARRCSSRLGRRTRSPQSQPGRPARRAASQAGRPARSGCRAERGGQLHGFEVADPDPPSPLTLTPAVPQDVAAVRGGAGPLRSRCPGAGGGEGRWRRRRWLWRRPSTCQSPV